MSKFISHATPKPSRLRFPKSSRLRETREYAQVRERGKSAQGRLLRLALLRRLEETPARIGIITSRRVGGAVIRNRVRRRLRELARHSLPGIPAGTWIVIVAKSAAATATLEDLRGEWLLLARRLSILPPLP